VFVTGLVVIGALRADYDPVRQFDSLLSLTADGWQPVGRGGRRRWSRCMSRDWRLALRRGWGDAVRLDPGHHEGEMEGGDAA
jgi:hypothetical protein